MKQQTFEGLHRPQWEALEAWLDGRGGAIASEDVPSAYRELCHHLALAQERSYGVPLHERLQSLAMRLHHRLYESPTQGTGLWRFLRQDLPSRVRSEWRLCLVASLLLFGAWAAVFVLVRRQPDLIHLFLNHAQAAEVVRMYDPAQRTAEMTGASRDVSMFGFYIWNNIGIDFQNFASGLLLGIGPLFVLTFNGAHGGAVMAHLTNQGLVATFYGFVSGHSSFELIGAALSGAGGLRLGLALMHPGRRSRGESLRAAGPGAVQLVLGAAFLTFVAACIEAFWSASPVPWKVKVALGVLGWILLPLWLLVSGRERP